MSFWSLLSLLSKFFLSQRRDVQDPARPEVADAMNLCQDAGVRVMVITGDSKDTATAIARDVNIFGPEEVRDFVGRTMIVWGPSRDYLGINERQSKPWCNQGLFFNFVSSLMGRWY